MAKASSRCMCDELERAIQDRINGFYIPAHEAHKKIKKLYTWVNVSLRTEKVYDMLSSEEDFDLSGRIKR